MSLDIWGEPTEETTRVCRCCGSEIKEFVNLFDFNITHNLRQMAEEAGCGLLWDYNIVDKKASILIEPLNTAINNLKSNPQKFEEFDSPNGWGTIDTFFPWLIQLLEKCEEFPDAILGISK